MLYNVLCVAATQATNVSTLLRACGVGVRVTKRTVYAGTSIAPADSSTPRNTIAEGITPFFLSGILDATALLLANVVGRRTPLKLRLVP